MALSATLCCRSKRKEVDLLRLLRLGVLSKLLGTMLQIIGRLPSVLRGSVILPLDEVLNGSLLLVETGIHDFLHSILMI